jgi:phospholipase C
LLDHYYGFAPFVGPSGVPPGYTQPDGSGGSVAPLEFTSLSTPDIGHSWSAVHSEWNTGHMDGFYATDGIDCMGYYTAAELPYYYSLFDDFTLCGSYFCSVLGRTWPTGTPPASAGAACRSPKKGPPGDDGVRAHVNAEVPRSGVRAPDPRVGEPPVRPVHPGRP